MILHPYERNTTNLSEKEWTLQKCSGNGTPTWKCCLSLLVATVALEVLYIVASGLHFYHGFIYQFENDKIRRNNHTGYHPPHPIHINPFSAKTPSSPQNEKTPQEFLRDWEDFCFKNKVGSAKNMTDMPMCPCIPTHLKGKLKVEVEVPAFGEIELAHPELEGGGHGHPTHCLALHHVAIIVPFRDREAHLRAFIYHMHPILQRQLLDYRIFIVEQASPDVFNKAAMMNAGYKEAKKYGSYDCFIFHDVDLLPEDDRNFYACSKLPRHVGSHCDKFDYKVPYAGIFGGAIALTGNQFELVNGFSNQFYGWGGEDDDMYRRVSSRKLKIERFPGTVARYTMLKHGKDNGNPYNRHSGVAWKWRPKHYLQDGLNTLRYRVRTTELRPLYTWFYVDIPSAPAYFYSRGKQGLHGVAAPPPGARIVHITLITSLLSFKFIYLKC